MAATYAFSAQSGAGGGVGYGVSPIEMQVLRFRDLTPPTPARGAAEALRCSAPSSTAVQVGSSLPDRGAAAEHRRSAQSRSEPGGAVRLFARRPVRAGRPVPQPDGYRSYIAASPSIWWNDCAVLAQELGFVRAVRPGDVAPRPDHGRRSGAGVAAPPAARHGLEDAQALMAKAGWSTTRGSWDAGWEAAPARAITPASTPSRTRTTSTGLAASIGRALDFAQRD